VGSAVNADLRSPGETGSTHKVLIRLREHELGDEVKNLRGELDKA
jgi:hypothetical protein